MRQPKRHPQFRLLAAAAVLSLLAVLAWAPWLTEEFAEERTLSSFEAAQQGIIDGCGFRCEGCGPEAYERALFGALLNLTYRCGMKSYLEGERFFVSAFGTVHPLKEEYFYAPSGNGRVLPAAECASDSGCGTGGCSGQVCGPKDAMAGLITTCEYRPEYDCLKLASCGCVEGSCQWRQSQLYRECIGRI